MNIVLTGRTGDADKPICVVIHTHERYEQTIDKDILAVNYARDDIGECNGGRAADRFRGIGKMAVQQEGLRCYPAWS